MTTDPLRRALQSGSHDQIARALTRHYTPAELVRFGLPKEAVTYRTGETVWTDEARATAERVARQRIRLLELSDG